MATAVLVVHLEVRQVVQVAMFVRMTGMERMYAKHRRTMEMQVDVLATLFAKADIVCQTTVVVKATAENVVQWAVHLNVQVIKFALIIQALGRLRNAWTHRQRSTGSNYMIEM